MPTIIDVAKSAGVSTATVSRVLSHPDRVAQSTRHRVMDVVKALGYTPNVAARSLRTLKASKILVTVPDISNPFFASVIRGVEEAARDAEYSVVLGDTRHDPVLENQYAEMLASREVDGLIFLGHRLPENLRDLVRGGGGLAPVVNGCEYSPELGVPSVHIDNAAAGSDAMEHLIALGHREFGIITGPLASPISQGRLTGALQATERHGLGGHVRLGHGDYSAQSAYQQTAFILGSRDVTALFCFSDEMAMGAIGAVADAGLRCPDDISVIGFDDIRLARFFQPGLTTIAQPKADIGRQAVGLLIDILSGGNQSNRQITLPHQLITRGSTKAVAAKPKKG